ncbi:hypothetical protein [Streptomyces sp. NPDC015414]|uniref:hypothetical protein n=1 Tax=Streptomyces sp. NPDC015414 TaxID=3364957 RepID=UPI0036FFA13F
MRRLAAEQKGVSSVHDRGNRLLRSPAVLSVLGRRPGGRVRHPLVVVALDLNPIANVYAWFSGAATLGIVLLMAATSLAVIGFFWQVDEPDGQRTVWRTVVALALAFAGPTCVVYLVVANFPLLAGTQGGWVNRRVRSPLGRSRLGAGARPAAMPSSCLQATRCGDEP